MTKRCWLPLLLWAFLAPACAPDGPATREAPPERRRHLVLLTDTSRWAPGALPAYRDRLAGAGYRVLVSGYPGETAGALRDRLPWLLQPGVDVLVYDPRLAGAAALDTLRAALARRQFAGRLELLGIPETE